MRQVNKTPWGVFMGETEAITSAGTSAIRTPAGSGGSSIHEKDDTPVVVYEKEGTAYYFLSNNGFESVTWKPDELTECTIGGEVPREDLQRIVDSLYE